MQSGCLYVTSIFKYVQFMMLQHKTSQHRTYHDTRPGFLVWVWIRFTINVTRSCVDLVLKSRSYVVVPNSYRAKLAENYQPIGGQFFPRKKSCSAYFEVYAYTSLASSLTYTIWGSQSVSQKWTRLSRNGRGVRGINS